LHKGDGIRFVMKNLFSDDYISPKLSQLRDLLKKEADNYDHWTQALIEIIENIVLVKEAVKSDNYKYSNYEYCKKFKEMGRRLSNILKSQQNDWINLLLSGYDIPNR